MKKTLALIILILLILSGASCDSTPQFDNTILDPNLIAIHEPWVEEQLQPGVYKAYFYIDNQLAYSITAQNNKINKPADPFKYATQFLGWYLTNGQLFDFNQNVYQSFKVYARFNDYPTNFVNQMATTYMSANVKVIATFKKGGFIGIGSSVRSTGSGVIFADSNERYYVLTNNHVVINQNATGKYAIIDYKGEQHDAQLKQHSAQASYDLAVLSFEKEDFEFSVLSLAESNPVIGDAVATISSPKGQNNTITLGTVQSYNRVVLENDESESNVLFDVIKHSSPTDSGSSGAMVLNCLYQIVGIHYAGPKDIDFKDRSYGYCIPVMQIRKYLTDYVLDGPMLLR